MHIVATINFAQTNMFRSLKKSVQTTADNIVCLVQPVEDSVKPVIGPSLVFEITSNLNK